MKQSDLRDEVDIAALGLKGDAPNWACKLLDGRFDSRRVYGPLAVELTGTWSWCP